MAEEPKSGSWWRSLPGILTAIAGIITAIGGLIFALNQAGLIGRIKEAPPQVQSGTTKPAPAISIEPPPTPGPGRTPKPVVAPKDRAIDSLLKNTKIAFTSGRDGNSEIYVMDADGTNLKRLTNSPANDFEPSWSPDGSKIAFASNRDGNVEIYVMDADGRNLRRLTNSASAHDHNPSWSPDGSKIAFASIVNYTKYQIYLINADGTNLRRLTDLPTGANYPCWLSGGTKILFTTIKGKFEFETEAYIIDADGRDPPRRIGGPVAIAPISCSPDGTRIAFSSWSGKDFNIDLMSVEGTYDRRLTTRPEGDTHPSWSPDGSKIAFASRRNRTSEIYVIDTDGTNLRSLTKIGFNSQPSWSPLLK